jgi:hypothetical protein
MPRMPETVDPSSAVERSLVERVAGALADDGRLLDAAALAGEPPDAAALVAALRERADEGAVVACVGVLERIGDFVGVVEALVTLVRERGVTVVLAVPNHEVAGEQRASTWSEGAVVELRGLLPTDHVAYQVLALRGAALVPADDGAQLTVTVDADPHAGAPTTFVLAFGPRAPRVAAAAQVAVADLGAERAYDRARTAELEVLRARVGAPELVPGDGGQP